MPNPIKCDRLFFVMFKDQSFLSVEPKGDNQVYIMSWSNMISAVAYASNLNFDEDVKIVSIDIAQMEEELKTWPVKQELILDRQPNGEAQLVKVSDIKHGDFISTDYKGEPPEFNSKIIDNAMLL